MKRLEIQIHFHLFDKLKWLCCSQENLLCLEKHNKNFRILIKLKKLPKKLSKRRSDLTGLRKNCKDVAKSLFFIIEALFLMLLLFLISNDCGCTKLIFNF